MYAGYVEWWRFHEQWFRGEVTSALDELRRLERGLETHPNRKRLEVELAIHSRVLGRLSEADRYGRPRVDVLLFTAFVRNDGDAVRRWATMPQPDVGQDPSVVASLAADPANLVMMARTGLR